MLDDGGALFVPMNGKKLKIYLFFFHRFRHDTMIAVAAQPHDKPIVTKSKIISTLAI